MTERANFQKNYLMRYAIMAGMCLFFAAYFAYDGFIGYPSNLPAAEAYDEIKEIRDPEERNDKWLATAKENGWSTSTPEKSAEQIQSDIRGQYIWMVVCLLGGIPALLLLLKSRGTWIEPTDNGLKTSWGTQLEFADVTQLDKKRWAKKGIARATYTTDGQSGTFVFDDFKYEREPIGQMLRKLESQLNRDQIIGGPTEAETDVEKAKSEAAADEATSDSTDDSEAT